MRGEDITPQTQFANKPQDEAVKNIQGARVFGVTPEIYQENKETLEPEVKALSLPTAATPVVARNIASSPDHAAAIAPDANKLSWIESTWNSFTDKVQNFFAEQGRREVQRAEAINKGTEAFIGTTKNAIDRKIGPEREMIDLGWKKLRAGGVGADQFTDDDELRLQALRAAAKEDFGRKDYGLTGPWETLPAEVIAQGVDMVALAGRNKKTIGSIVAAETALGAGTGAAVGSIAGGVGAGPGALTGAGIGLRSGLVHGYLAASFIDAYQTTAGQTFNELEEATDAAGRPLNIDPETKQYISHGVGVVSGSLSVVTDKLMIKSVPWMKKLLTPGSVKEILSNPANSAMKQALLGIGKSMAINGTEEGLQEIAQIVGEEIGNSYKDGEASFTNGLLRAAEKLEKDPKTRGRVGQAALVGAASAGTFAAAGSAVDAGVQTVQINQEIARVEKVYADENARRKQKRQDVILENQGATRVIPQTVKQAFRPTDIPENLGTPTEQAVQVLEFQDVIDASSEVAKTAGLHKISKEEVSEIRQQIVEESGVKHVYLDKEELQKFADNEEKAERVRQIIDPTGQAAAAINAPIKVETHKFLDLVDDYPELSEYVKLHPQGPSPNSARVWAQKQEEAVKAREKLRAKLEVGEKSPEERAYNLKVMPDVDDQTLAEGLGSKEVADAYLARLDVNEVEETADKAAIAVMRERVTKLRDTLPDDVTAKQVLEQALNTAQPVNDVFNEPDYLNQPTFTEAIEGVLSDKEVETINKAQMEARQQIVEQINDSAKWEMNKVIDVVEEIAVEVQHEIEMDRIKNDPNVAVVDKFLTPAEGYFQNTRFRNAEETKAAHHKPGYSPFAIDPRTLTDEQKKKYLKDPQLRKHRVFVKGGLSANDSAALVGVSSGDNLLRILSTTPSRQEVIKGAVDKKRAGLRKQAEENTDLFHTAIAEAYHKQTYNHLQEMKYLKSEKWAATKKGIKRIALPLPRIEELTNKARLATLQTKVGDLSPTQFKVGERKSQRIAVDAILKNDIEKAFINKEAAALNSELTIAQMIAIGQVNRVIRLAKRMESKSNQQVLKDAGKLYVDAYNEIVDVFNLNPSKRGQAEQGAYQKWVKEQVEAGNGNFEIPERLSDVRQSINEMTVEEVLAVGDRLKAIMHTAKLKNKLLAKYGDEAREIQTREALVAKLHAEAQMHPDYKPDRAVVKQGALSPMQKLANILNDTAAMLKNAEHILLNADNGKVGGLFNESIMAPLKGIGKYAGQGEQGKATDMVALGKQVDRIIADFNGEQKLGEKLKGSLRLGGWAGMENNRIEVPEFANNPLLNYGKLTEGSLFVMLLNNGNEGNLQRMADNFGTDIDTIRKVLDRKLDERHAIAAQRIMDLYKSYFPRVKALHEEVTGITPEFVEAVPFTFKGKVYPGGYYPLNYGSEMSLDRIRRRTDDAQAALAGEKEFALRDHFYTDDMTRHGHTEKRTGSNEPINLSMGSIGMGFEMILHDLNFRKPIAHALKIVTDPTVAKDLGAIVGLQDYNVVVNTIVEAAGSVAMENNALFDSTKFLDRVQSNARSGLSVAYLVGNVGSIAIQPVSLVYALERMGVSGQKHILATLGKLSTNPTLIGQFYEFAGEIHPAIKAYLEGIDDNTRDAISKKMPVKNLSPGLAPLDAMREFVNDSGFWALGQVDQLQKVIIAISAYSQFLQGDAPGFDFETVQKMTPEERDHQAKVYASSLSRLTLTAGSQIDRAPIQKKYKNVAMFFNDARNAINNTMRQGREIRQRLNRKEYRQAATAATLMFTTLAMAKIMEDLIRGNPTPWNEEESEDDEQSKVSKMLAYLGAAPVKTISGNVPFVRDIKFVMENQWGSENNRTVPSLQTKVATDLYYAATVGLQFMELVNDEREVSRKQAKAIGFTASYLTGGLPVNAAFKAWDWLETKEFDPGIFVPSLADTYKSTLDDFKKAQAELPADEQVSEEVMKALEDIDFDLEPAKDGARNETIPEGAIETIKQIESGGDVFAKNPNSSAAGLYQFTEDTWEFVMDSAPELALTAEGRVAADGEQQERAMAWFTDYNARVLGREGIDVTTENLYAAHFLGAEKAVEVLGASADTKMKLLISGEAMAANDFKNSMRVKDFKSWVSRKVSSASRDVAALDNE